MKVENLSEFSDATLSQRPFQGTQSVANLYLLGQIKPDPRVCKTKLMSKADLPGNWWQEWDLVCWGMEVTVLPSEDRPGTWSLVWLKEPGRVHRASRQRTRVVASQCRGAGSGREAGGTGHEGG